ncbi:MAG: hypothetical protein ACYC6G_19325 [Desulfobaccales bacterium]
MNLITEFERIKKDHKQALRRTGARVVLGSSVIRVFQTGTKERLLLLLSGIPVEEMPSINGQKEFRSWFEHWLDVLAQEIKKLNPDNSRIHPGYKWGHATKILTLYIREIVLNSRYFTDAQVQIVAPWLYIPIDNIAMQRLAKLGYPLPFKSIKEIDTPGKFYEVQDLLSQAADEVGVPRIWFDDNWGDRQ